MPYLSGGLDQCCRTPAGRAVGCRPVHTLQQDPGSGHMAPGHAQTGLDLAAEAPRHVVRDLQSNKVLLEDDTGCLMK